MSPLQLRASDAALRRELTRAMQKGDLVAKERNAGAVNCTLGRSSLRIDPEGNVYPCSRWLQPIGNVRKDDLSTIWQAPDRKRVAAIANAANDALAETSRWSTFPFCPAIAVSSGSIPTVPSPAQQRVLDLADESWRDLEPR
jgi:radical SAM protein with 4Fe4S-binding SPASM domain